MGDSYSWKQGARPGQSPSPGKPTAATATRAPSQPSTATRPPAHPTAAKPGTSGTNSSDQLAGRIVHDERGNAVWDWLKDTARIAIDSTSRLLRKLEVPELEVEETQEQELRIESDRDAGGGYDPYGGSGTTTGRSSNSRNLGGNAGGRSGPSGNTGGGYDPYGKGVTSKPTRKR